MNVGVIGTSGVIGRRLVVKLKALGLLVRAIVRPGSDSPLPTGIEDIAIADILDQSALEQALQGLDAVVNLATRIPSAGGEWQQNDRIRTEGTRALLAALASQAKPPRLVQQSIAMLHQSSEWADEDGELCGQGVLGSALRMEAMVQTAALDWVLIRGGALYGPDTARDIRYVERIRDGALGLPKERERFISFVHVDDLAEAFAVALDVPARNAYIACDDRPLTYHELFAGLAATGAMQTNAAPLPTLPSFRTSNRRLRTQGWKLAHPDVLAQMQSELSRLPHLYPTGA
ncbi:NAD-dependent epimerase/dehydratase family protein [Herbaspirillum seropedicae]|uniref:NAD-dependent epimerase/dehydratase family protein n=1 Tax=Herbaspirillum seropedicae TaxID=964 RepID=UPI003F8D2E93